MSYTATCPKCGEPNAVRIVTWWERQGDGPMAQRTEFVEEVVATCGCELSEQDEEAAIDGKWNEEEPEPVGRD